MIQKVKGPGIILFVIAVCVILVSALFPSEVMTSKWIILGVDKKDVIAKLNTLNDYNNWNDLLLNKSELNVEQQTSLISKGDKISWKNASGTYDMIMIKNADTTGVGFEIITPGALPIQSGISVAAKGDSVQVVWSIVEKLRWYPWEKVYGMMASDMKGPAMQHSLETFKSQLENH